MTSFCRNLPAILACALFCLGANTVTRADTINIRSADSGWYDVSGMHDATNKNYIAGEPVQNLPPLHSISYRNFFVFDLAGVSGTITKAQIRLYAAVVTGTGPYQLFDVVTPLSQLSATQNNRTDIFADLGSGVSYGSINITPADFGNMITIDLNAAAIAALQRSGSGTFAVGGFFDVPPGNTVPGQFAFGVSVDDVPDPRNQLVLQTETVPETATLLLLGAGLAGVAAKVRRRRTTGS